MEKKKLTDEALLKLIRKFIEENPVLNTDDCDDEVAKLIGKDSLKPSSN